MVDSNGLIIKALVTPANYGDRKGLLSLLNKITGKFKLLKTVYGDMGYQGFDFTNQVLNIFKKKLEVVKRPRKYFWVPNDVKDVAKYLIEKGCDVVTGFQVQTKRWIVERTFAWLGKYRRLSKDYEFNMHNSENMIYLAMIKNMLKNTA